MRMRRRALLQWIAGLGGALRLPGLRLWAQAADFPADRGETLRVLAAVVLPAELGAAGIDRVAEEFAVWVRGYRAGAEMDHGYGNTRLRAKAASPAPSYLAAARSAPRGAGRERCGSAARCRHCRPGAGPHKRPAAHARRPPHCRRPDGVLLPLERRQRPLLPRRHRPRLLPRSRRIGKGSRAAAGACRMTRYEALKLSERRSLRRPDVLSAARPRAWRRLGLLRKCTGGKTAGVTGAGRMTRYDALTLSERRSFRRPEVHRRQERELGGTWDRLENAPAARPPALPQERAG